ncbi:aspartic peptidase domain-containing protein [Crassisporium funariophilum]|nr:aspartic peptidase domain-containing protein [Crassisporium funariophilum]
MFLPLFVQWRLFLVVLLAALASRNPILSVAALPARECIPEPLYLALPIARPQRASSSQTFHHGSIVQQQHTNRGVRRLALMTGRTPPTRDVLSSYLDHRLSLLPANPQYKYTVAKHVEAVEYSSNSTVSSRPLLAESGSPSPDSGAMPPSRVPTTVKLDIESNDIGYMCTVQIGTPPKPFRLLVDSGSGDLWVGGEGCQSNDGGDCGPHALLGPKSSTTFRGSKEEWAIGYVSGSVAGFLVRDDINIGGLMLKSHTFGAAMNESKDFTPADIPFDGLLGLATSIISQQRVPTFLDSLYASHLISAPIASYKIPRLADGKDDGELTLGAMNPRHFDSRSLVTVPNVNKFGYWGVAVDAVKVGHKDMGWANITVVVDTGTTLIIAPKPAVDEIHSHIPGSKFDGGGWTVPCTLTTIISLTIGGQKFSIDPRDIAFYPVDPENPKGDCMSGIGIGGVGPFYLDNEWLVGDVFLKNVYFSTDEAKNQVSIAKLKTPPQHY